MRIPLRRLFPVTSAACEALSLLALFLSPDLPAWFFGGMLALALLSVVFRLSDRWLLPILAAVVVGGIYAGVRTFYPIELRVATPMLALHALTWLARDQTRYRYWRIGLAFLEMIFAAIVAPEAHMFFLIFFFVILLSSTLSFGFLEQNFARREPAGLDRPLRPAYLGAVLFLSFVIFLSSLAIFPLLPRKEGIESGSAGAMPGFSEEVSFQTATFYWTGDENKAVMWLFRATNVSWEEALPYGLLRGKTLERFDGKTWRARNVGGGPDYARPSTDWQVEILREPMPSDALPVPYGTDGVDTAAPFRYPNGDWYQPAARGRRMNYVARVSRDISRDRALGADEKVFPEGFARVRELAATLGKNLRTDRERVDAVLKYFQNGFTAEQVPVAGAAEKGLGPIENFLFERRAGHCELFATSAALLLRAMGVPTRLVVGFRVPQNRSTGEVVTIRNGDAHAWLEVWGSEGWLAVDPTPAIAANTPVWQAARDFYDWVTAYWHRYILGYEFSWRATGRWVVWAFYLGGSFVGLAALRKLWRLARARRKKSARDHVGTVRVWLEKKLRLTDLDFERAIKDSAWWAEYLRLRYGRVTPTLAEVAALKVSAREIIRRLNARAG